MKKQAQIASGHAGVTEQSGPVPHQEEIRDAQASGPSVPARCDKTYKVEMAMHIWDTHKYNVEVKARSKKAAVKRAMELVSFGEVDYYDSYEDDDSIDLIGVEVVKEPASAS